VILAEYPVYYCFHVPRRSLCDDRHAAIAGIIPITVTLVKHDIEQRDRFVVTMDPVQVNHHVIIHN
jgi:hypothetical protein